MPDSESPAKQGGKRRGSGRKLGGGRFGEPTVAIRVPESTKATVLDFVGALAKNRSGVIPALMPPGAMQPVAEPVPFALPLFSYSVRAGFPSPADDYTSESLDLNEHLIAHKEATFFLRVKGNSMIGAGIHDGDLLVVDRSITPTHRKVVIAVVDGEFTVKRLYKRAGKIRLMAENPDFAPIEFLDGQELQIFGVVTNVIHAV